MSTNFELVRLLKLRRKFNETLEDILTQYKHMHIMIMTSMTEMHYFNDKGDLTEPGQTQFWAEFNHHLKCFDFEEEDLLPQKTHAYKTSFKRYCGIDQFHWNNTTVRELGRMVHNNSMVDGRRRWKLPTSPNY